MIVLIAYLAFLACIYFLLSGETPRFIIGVLIGVFLRVLVVTYRDWRADRNSQ